MRLSAPIADALRRLSRAATHGHLSAHSHNFVALVHHSCSSAAVAAFRCLLVAAMSTERVIGTLAVREFALSEALLADAERVKAVRSAKLLVVLATRLSVADLGLWLYEPLCANTAFVAVLRRDGHTLQCDNFVGQAHKLFAWHERGALARAVACAAAMRTFTPWQYAGALAEALASARGQQAAGVCERAWHRLYALQNGAATALDSDDQFVHPFAEHNVVVGGARHIRTFRSQAAPKLVDLLDIGGRTCGRVILKAGDDLALDAAVMSALRLLNDVWRRFDVRWVWRDEHGPAPASELGSALVQHRTYGVAPRRNSRTGFVEMLEGCAVSETRDRNSAVGAPLAPYAAVNNDYSAHEAGGEEYCRAVASVVALGVASFVLGIRDRHQENVLRLAQSGEYVNIDLQWCFGDGPTVDTHWFPLMRGMRTSLERNGHWGHVKRLSWHALNVLRAHEPLLCAFVRELAPDNARRSAWPSFVSRQLAIDAERFDSLLEWGSWRKKPKDWLHELASDGFAQFLKRRI